MPYHHHGEVETATPPLLICICLVTLTAQVYLPRQDPVIGIKQSETDQNLFSL